MSREFRSISAAEFGLGAMLVIGHNVLKIVPNEVPILFVLGMISVRVRNGGWAAIGLKRPASWGRVVVWALAAAALRIILGAILEPLTALFWPPAALPEGVDAIKGNAVQAARWLGIVWTFAAFGEEIGYRGYLITRAAEAASGSKAAYWGGMVAVAILFGLGHYYKGPAGMIDSGMAGLVLGAAYLLSGRCLWTAILAHGFIDTFGVMALFLGLGS